jgi:hypothetical protein
VRRYARFMVLGCLALLSPSVSGETGSEASLTVITLTIPLPQGSQGDCEAQARRLADPLTVLLGLPVYGECLRITNPDGVLATPSGHEAL